MTFQLPVSFRKRYLERRYRDLLILEKGNIEDFKRIGHQMRGSAKSFDCTELEEIALRLGQVSDETFNELSPLILVDLKSCLLLLLGRA